MDKEKKIKKLRKLVKEYRKTVGISEKANWGGLEIEGFIRFLASQSK